MLFFQLIFAKVSLTSSGSFILHSWFILVSLDIALCAVCSSLPFFFISHA